MKADCKAHLGTTTARKGGFQIPMRALPTQTKHIIMALSSTEDLWCNVFWQHLAAQKLNTKGRVGGANRNKSNSHMTFYLRTQAPAHQGEKTFFHFVGFPARKSPFKPYWCVLRYVKHMSSLVVLYSLQHILSGHRRPMLELANDRPLHWPSLEIPRRPGDELNCSQQSGQLTTPIT